MRLSAFFSLVAHVSVVAAGLWVSQGEAYKPEPSTPMIVIPLELMTIGEVTDIAPVVADAPKEEEAASVEEVTETFTSASAPKPAEDVVNLEAAPPPPPPKKEEVKKQEAKPAPAKKEEDLNSFLDSMLTDVKKDKPKAAPAPAGAKTATAETGPARMGAGERASADAGVAGQCSACGSAITGSSRWSRNCASRRARRAADRCWCSSNTRGLRFRSATTLAGRCRRNTSSLSRRRTGSTSSSCRRSERNRMTVTRTSPMRHFKSFVIAIAAMMGMSAPAAAQLRVTVVGEEYVPMRIAVPDFDSEGRWTIGHPF